jgi:hypothetical protein
VPHSFFPRSRARPAIIAATLAIALLALAPHARAQEVLGYGEDATTTPAGAIRVRLSNDWHRDRRIGTADDSTYDVDQQYRASTIGLELGVLKRFSIGLSVPWVTTKALAYVSSPHTHITIKVKNGDTTRTTSTENLLDTLVESSRNGWGNIEALGKIVWLGEPGQHARLAPRDGVHVRSAVVGGFLFGTGILSNAGDPFNIGTSDRARALIAESATDLTVGKHFFGTIVGRYEKPMSDNVPVGVHAGDNPFANDLVTFVAQRKLGTKYEIEFTPRYQLGQFFAVGAQYRYRHGAQDSYIGQGSATDTLGNMISADASTLDAGTEITEHRAGFGVVYSAVDAYTRNRARIPVEVTFEYSRIVKISNDLPRPSEVVLSVRVFKRMWGAEFMPAPRPPKMPSLEPEPAPAPPPAPATSPSATPTTPAPSTTTPPAATTPAAKTPPAP